MCEYSIVDNETGVIVGELKSGDVIIPVEERKRRCEMRKKREGRYRSKGERYIFVNATFDFSDLPPSIVTKLIYLSTYADYNNSLVASIKSKTAIKRCPLFSAAACLPETDRPLCLRAGLWWSARSGGERNRRTCRARR